MTLNEASKKRTIPLKSAYIAQQAALMRLQLYMTGATHQVLRDFYEKAQRAITKAAGSEGKLDGLGMAQVVRTIESEWKNTFTAWQKLFEMMLREAVSIPFGTLALHHNTLVKPNLDEAWNLAFDDIFGPQLELMIGKAKERVHSDGLNWSQRVWRLDQDSLAGMRKVIFNGAGNGVAAWDIAKDLEQYLGAGQGCPRWTRARLYSLTKKSIASGDRTGLLSGDECGGKGVAYKALRLARNEIQIVHHMATDELVNRMPWIEKEKVNLSPDHPVDDICDEVARGGENGDGVYPKGEISLPLHVQCSPPGQMVITKNGSVPIEDILVGDEVLTHKERFKKVTATMNRSHSGYLVKIRTASGKEILVTPDHPILVNGKWKSAGEIKVGEHVKSAE